MTPTKITLPESEIPTHFYNIVPDLPTLRSPPLHPGTREPIGPDMLGADLSDVVDRTGSVAGASNGDS